MKTKQKVEPTQIEKEQLEVKSFFKCIAPSIADFRQSYYVFGNTYRCVWAIKDYPSETKNSAILRNLGEADGVTLHIYIKTIPSIDEGKIFTKASRRYTHTANTSHDRKEAVESSQNVEDITDLILRMQTTKEPLVCCSVFIEITAHSLKELDNLKADIASKLNCNNILYDVLWLQQQEGFRSVQLSGKDLFGSQFQRILPASSVANFFPFSYSGKTDPNGFMIGRDVHGTNVVVDFDRRSTDKTNGHILILGNSGEGKSYLLKGIITCFRQARKKLYSLDPENELENLTVNLGGDNLNMMSGEYIINVLEHKLWNNGSDDNEGDDYIIPASFKKKTLLSQHIAFLRDFFSVYKDFNTAQLDTIEILLEELYKRFHISDNTDFSKLNAEDYPILSDLYTIAKEKLDNFEKQTINTIYTKDILREICLGIYSISVGAESVFFNGTTNIKNANHINFAVKDMLTTNEKLMNAMYFNILSFMSHKFLTEGKTVICCDELHELLKNKIVLNYLRSFIKRGRKKNSDVVLASQNVSDFFLPEIVEYTKPLLSIPTHKFLFFPGTVDEQEYCRIMSETSSEFSVHSKPHQGYCLYRCGNERYYLHVIIPKYKVDLFGNAGGK